MKQSSNISINITVHWKKKTFLNNPKLRNQLKSCQKTITKFMKWKRQIWKMFLSFVFILLTTLSLFTWLAMPTTMNKKASSFYFVAPYNSTGFLLLYVNTNRTFELLFPTFNESRIMMYLDWEMEIPIFSNYVKLCVLKNCKYLLLHGGNGQNTSAYR